MWWLLSFIPGAIIGFLTVILVRACLFRPKAETTTTDTAEEFDRERATACLQALVRCKTISYRDPSLEEGVESVKSVAILSGFSDALYFSKIFKQETGMTPSAYFQRRRDEKLNQS